MEFILVFNLQKLISFVAIKEGSDLQSLYSCQYFLASTPVLTGKY